MKEIRAGYLQRLHEGSNDFDGFVAFDAFLDRLQVGKCLDFATTYAGPPS